MKNPPGATNFAACRAGTTLDVFSGRSFNALASCLLANWVLSIYSRCEKTKVKSITIVFLNLLLQGNRPEKILLTRGRLCKNMQPAFGLLDRRSTYFKFSLLSRREYFHKITSLQIT